MAGIACPECGKIRKIEIVYASDGWHNPPCGHCGDPGWTNPLDADDPFAGRKPLMGVDWRVEDACAVLLEASGTGRAWRDVPEADKEITRRAVRALLDHLHVGAGQAALRILADASRCEHGRHEGDACSLSDGCGWISHGNPHLRPGSVFGYTIHGRGVYRVPERGFTHDPAAWGPHPLS